MQSRSIYVSVRRQVLTVYGPGRGRRRSYPVSTSQFGLGMKPGSLKTPLGRFAISEKIGAGAPLGAIFKSRVLTGKTGDPANPADLIQTRILWLEGLDPRNTNTRGRYIYIHGTNHEADIGTPASHGCIRMRNADVAELYGLVAEGTPVFIRP